MSSKSKRQQERALASARDELQEVQAQTERAYNKLGAMLDESIDAQYRGETGWGLGNGTNWAKVLEYLPDGATASHPDDYKNGDFRPFWDDAYSHAMQAGVGSWFGYSDPVGGGMVENLCNYTLGRCLHPKFEPKKQFQTEQDSAIAVEVMSVLEEILSYNRWDTELQRETYSTEQIKGDAGIDVEGEGDEVYLNPIDSSWIAQPIDTPDDGLDWKYGVARQMGKCRDEAYFVAPYAIPDMSEIKTPESFWFTKQGSPAMVKRGMSMFYAAFQLLERASVASQRMIHGVSVQASIALIRQWNTPKATAERIGGNATKGTTPGTAPNKNGTRRPINQIKAVAGSIIDSPEGMNTMLGPLGQSAHPVLMMVTQFVYRIAGARKSMPEFMVTQDASNGTYACHDSETELLTKRGWLRYSEIAYGDQVGTMNPDTRRFEWQELTAININDYKGEMVRFKGKHDLDAMVTPNHRMYVAKEQNRRRHGKMVREGLKEWGFLRADEIYGSHVIPMACLPKEGIPTETFTIPAVEHNRKYLSQLSHPSPKTVSMSAFCRYLGWWISEGWCNSRRPYVVGVSQSIANALECDDIRNTIAKLDVVSSREHDGANGMTAWAAPNKQLWTWLRENCGKGSYSKRLPEFIHSLPSCQQSEMLASLLLGDGHHRENGSAVYVTVSKQLADGVQSLAIQCGFTSHQRSPRKNGILSLSIRKPRKTRIRKEHISRVPYDGKVWCVEVPNGIIVTRRNGKMLIAGNSLLAAEAPFTKGREADQARVRARFIDLYWIIIRVACQIGRINIPYGILRQRFELTVPEVGVAARDREKETARHKILVDNSIESKADWAQSEGLDHNEQQAKIIAERKEEPPTQIFEAPLIIALADMLHAASAKEVDPQAMSDTVEALFPTIPPQTVKKIFAKIKANPAETQVDPAIKSGLKDALTQPPKV